MRTMRTITLMLTIIVCPLAATYIPSTAYVHTSRTKLTRQESRQKPQAQKFQDARRVDRTSGAAEIAEMASQAYTLVPLDKHVVRISRVESCCQAAPQPE